MTPAPLERGATTTLSPTGSHFGVHLGTLDYAGASGYITELGGQIYVRNEVFRDAVGWRKVGTTAAVSECQDCCDPSHGPCTCQIGSFYYCQPSTRASLLATPILVQFYQNHFNQEVDFYAGRYDDAPPSSSLDLVAAYPYGHENIYHNYASYLAYHFGDQVKYWTVGNENDLSQFWAGTAPEYANLIAMASSSIRAQRPDCRVGASFSAPYVDQSWYDAMSSVAADIDFIDVHYNFSVYIQQGLMDWWKNACPGKELICTECGVRDSTGAGDAGGSRDEQARDLARYNTLLFAEGYDKLFWFLIDTDFGVPIFLHMGLIDEDGTVKPAFYAYQTMIAKVDGFTAITRLATGLYRYDFADRGPVYVAWCESGPCPVLPLTGEVRVTDYQGRETIQTASTIALSPTAVYLEAATSTSVPAP